MTDSFTDGLLERFDSYSPKTRTRKSVISQQSMYNQGIPHALKLVNPHRGKASLYRRIHVCLAVIKKEYPPGSVSNLRAASLKIAESGFSMPTSQENTQSSMIWSRSSSRRNRGTYSLFMLLRQPTRKRFFSSHTSSIAPEYGQTYQVLYSSMNSSVPVSSLK